MKNKSRMLLKITAGVLVASFGIMTTFAGSLSNMSDTLSSVKVGTPANHTLVFTTPNGIGSGSTTVITLQSDFAMDALLDFNDVDINVGGPYLASSTIAAAPSGATVGVVRTSATVLTITNGTTVIPPASTVYIRIGTNAILGSVGTHQVTNTTTSGNKTVAVAGNMWDNGTTTVNILTNDIVAVNAIVPQSLTFSISQSSINFGNLTNASARYASTSPNGDTTDLSAAHTLSIATNAPSGYTITLRGDTLTSQQNSANTITAIGASPAASSPNSEQFGIYATKTGSGSLATPYATASSFGFNSSSTTPDTFATGLVPTAADVYSLHYLANIAALTEAGTYSTNLVYVGTSNF